MRVRLTGRTAHASQPETGLSPAPALARLIPGLTGLSQGADQSDPQYRLVTITHARLGEAAFGIAPGAAELWATLRSQRDDGMAALVTEAEAMVSAAALDSGLAVAISYEDIFAACTNDPDAVRIFCAALEAEGIAHSAEGLPMRASEDFGRFGHGGARAAMVLLGAGDVAALHSLDSVSYTHLRAHETS